ncbi:putative virulence related protein PagC [Erwinia persicina]|uniref:Ail/Lom family outer membrane beta-barrel protein n=1 Tax=Erwinia persicina TaxID=55211 RepID=UPI00209F1032|nr:Ail/Lom family outer membrane beta-barrel protein [Erwinia persicina]MCP1437313.1 putative virulence related protein PagC [Erwinia persicina]
MKVKITALALVCSGLLVSTGVLADSHTLSVGYAQSKVEDFKNIRGVNVQYRYEWDSPVSIIGSFSYMKGDDSYSERVEAFDDISGYDGKTDVKYYSFMAGPAWRINDYVSLYALAGMAHTKVEDKTTYLSAYSEEDNASKTSFAYGAGVAINPTDYLSVNIGYEGTRVKFNDNVAINGFNIGLGYRF